MSPGSDEALDERCTELMARTGVQVSRFTRCRKLRVLDLTLKKSFVAEQRLRRRHGLMDNLGAPPCDGYSGVHIEVGPSTVVRAGVNVLDAVVVSVVGTTEPDEAARNTRATIVGIDRAVAVEVTLGRRQTLYGPEAARGAAREAVRCTLSRRPAGHRPRG